MKISLYFSFSGFSLAFGPNIKASVVHPLRGPAIKVLFLLSHFVRSSDSVSEIHHSVRSLIARENEALECGSIYGCAECGNDALVSGGQG